MAVKKGGIFSFLVHYFIGGIEKALIRESLPMIATIIFLFVGLFFLAMAFEKFLELILPPYISFAIIAFIFFQIALILKRRW